MGDIADQIMDQILENNTIIWGYKKSVDTKPTIVRYDVWTTSNDDRIKLIDMDEFHIHNCINMLKRKNIKSGWTEAFYQELLRRKQPSYSLYNTK